MNSELDYDSLSYDELKEMYAERRKEMLGCVRDIRLSPKAALDFQTDAMTRSKVNDTIKHLMRNGILVREIRDINGDRIDEVELND